MTKSKSRRRIAFTTLAGAAVLALSSAAVACVAYEGKMTVKSGGGTSTAIGSGSGDHEHCFIEGGARAFSADNRTGTVTVTVEAYANQGPSDPCQSSKLYKSNGSDEITHYDPQPEWFLPGGICYLAIDLECITGYDTQEQKGIGPYEVRFVNGNAFTRTTGANPTYTHVRNNPNLTCAGYPEDPPASYILLGHLDVDDTGYGAWTGNLPTDSQLVPNGPTDAAGICVRAQQDDSRYHLEMRAGNQAPIVVM